MDSVTWRRILRAADYRCFYCGVQSLRLTRDHKIPVSRGGDDTLNNIVPCCARCNNLKGTRTAEEYVASRRSSPRSKRKALVLPQSPPDTTPVPTAIYARNDVSIGARWLYALLAMHAKQGTAPSQFDLAEDMEANIRTVSSYLRELENARLIDVRRAGRYDFNQYTLLEPW